MVGQWRARGAIVPCPFALSPREGKIVNAAHHAPGVACFMGRLALHRGRMPVGLLAALALAGCVSSPPQGASRPEASPAASAPRVIARPGPAPSSERDGPDAQPPADLAAVPDAEPRVEPIRAGGPNKPYEALGRSYVPIAQDRAYVERGLASWYGRKFHGRRTASGEVYNMYEMTAAHPTLPIPSYARVRNPANGREVVVRVNDRGPFHPGRVIDLSYTAALKLDLLRGVAPVEVERITHDEIRSGAWRRGPPDAAPAWAASGSAPATAAVSSPAATPVLAPAPALTQSSVTASAPMPALESPSAPVALAAAARPTPQRAEPTRTPPGAEPTRRAYTGQAKGYWVQVGAFRDRTGAEAFQRRVATELDWLAPLLAIFDEASMHRIQAGPYASRDDANSTLQRIRDSLQLVPVMVERR